RRGRRARDAGGSGQHAGAAHSRPVQSDGGCGRNGHDAERQSGRGDGEHDLGLAQLPDQRRRDEYGQEPAAESAAAGHVRSETMTVHATSALASPLQQTPTGASSATATSSSATGTSAQSLSDTFLKLLVAQMKNQDPLNPVDNSQVTSQMAQISTVTGISSLNSTV